MNIDTLKATWEDPKTWHRMMGKNNLDTEHFRKSGADLVGAMLSRFKKYRGPAFHKSTILEIGCGLGRFLRPLAAKFATVVGTDMVQYLLDIAENKYCAGLRNIWYQLTDGVSLKQFGSESMDYVFSMGVFKHITEFDVIAGYIREGLRVLKPGGMFMFVFDGTHTLDRGHGTLGAKITAAKLDAALAGCHFRIREVSHDSLNPNRQVMVVVLQKTKAAAKSKPLFAEHTLTDSPYTSAAYGKDPKIKVSDLTFYEE